MKAKEYLQQISKLDAVISFRTARLERMIEQKIEQIERWYSIATKTTTTMQTVKIGEMIHGIEKVQSSGSKDSMAKAICEMLDLQSVYVNEFTPIIQKGLEEIMSVEAEREEIIKTLELLPTNEYKLLYLIYAGKENERLIDGQRIKTIKYLTLDEAADELGKSKRTVDTLHGSGLAKVQKIIDENC